jgi:hypothetical protein
MVHYVAFSTDFRKVKHLCAYILDEKRKILAIFCSCDRKQLVIMAGKKFRSLMERA